MVKGMARLLFAAFIFYMTVSSTIGFVKLTRFVNNNNGHGKYSFEFKTSDGTYRKEDGGLVQSPEGDVFVVRGEYGYVDPEGHQYVVHYVADTNGYRPQHFDDNTRFNDRRIL